MLAEVYSNKAGLFVFLKEASRVWVWPADAWHRGISEMRLQRSKKTNPDDEMINRITDPVSSVNRLHQEK